MSANKFVFGILGFLSGVISSLFWNIEVIDSPTFIALITSPSILIPGFTFGTLISLFFNSRKFGFKNIIVVFSFISISIIAFILSFVTAIFSIIIAFLNFIPAGIVGAAILVFAIDLFYAKIDLKSMVYLTIWGGILGVSLYIPPITYDDPDALFYPLFLIWQGGMAFLIAHFLSSKDKQLKDDGVAS